MPLWTGVPPSGHWPSMGEVMHLEDWDVRAEYLLNVDTGLPPISVHLLTEVQDD